MSSPAATAEAPASPAADETPDPAVRRAERRLRLLEELAEIGMELARSLRPGDPASGASRLDATEDPPAETGRAKGRDPADVFGPLSRAIRLTLVLEARTDAELRDLKAGLTRVREDEQARAAERDRVAAAKDLEARIERIRDLVLCVADAETPDTDAFESLYEALDERLEAHEADIGAGRPLRETVERLCKDLALSPDWSRWAGERWIVDDAPVDAGPQPPEAKENAVRVISLPVNPDHASP
ncbi:MAG: hypothetical protein M3T55_07785 [Pseudomonadota bacterium]|nr:hypothetical protein [Pseudomonadota bacterium]